MHRLPTACTLLVAVLTLGCATNPSYQQLVRLNAAVNDAYPENCQEHARQVQQSLLELASFSAEDLYSCPNGMDSTFACHVSVLVVAPDGSKWVLDNGAILNQPAIAVAGVASYEDFLWWMDERPSWTGPDAKKRMRRSVILARQLASIEDIANWKSVDAAE